MYAKNKKIYTADLSKNNSNLDFKSDFFPSGNGCNHLAIEKISALSRKITSKHYGDFCCLDCLHFFGTKNKLKSLEKYVKMNTFVM